MQIAGYDNNRHRRPVMDLWSLVFGYTETRNQPALSIDKKLQVDDGLFFIAMDQDIVVGTVMAGYDGHRGWIYSLAVDPQHRAQGIGTRLLNHAEQELQRRGCVKVNLQILSTNDSVKEFYLRNGYAVEPRISMGKVLV
jgi:ribosomal protein S18 acetylase RimI-like enzyme